MILRIIVCSDNVTEMILSNGYLECTGLAKALEETQIWLRSYINNKTSPQERQIFNQLRKLLMNQKMYIIKELNQINQIRPWVGYTIRTKQAILNLLISLDAELDDYKDKGLLDNLEAGLLKRELESMSKITICHLNYIKPLEKSKYLFSIPWLGDDADLIALLTSYSESMELPSGVDVVIEGQLPDELFFISTGIVKMNYRPTGSVIENLMEWGMVPNRGFVSSLEFDAEGSDVLHSMNLIGLHGILTGREYSASIKTLTNTHIYRIPRESLLLVINSKNPDYQKMIIERMWRHYALNLSKHLMLINEAHQSRLTRQMRSDLYRGFMVTLKPRQGIHLTSCVRDALLLEGVLETWGDDLTGFKFVAPVVLSHTVTRLRAGKVPGWMGTTWAARVYIVPIADITLDVVRQSLNINEQDGSFNIIPKMSSSH